jgi:phosphoglycerate dehydrogenase-like enzyme
MTNVLIDAVLPSECLDRLRALPQVSVRTLTPELKARPLPAEMLRDTHILLCKLPPENFDDLRQLKLMQLSTVGYEHLRHLGLGERPICVCNARGVFDTAIAEWNLAMMINLTRNLQQMIRNQERSHWEKTPVFQQEIRGKTLGLWGYGGIGRDTARLAKAFGLTVHVMTRSGIKKRENTYVQPGSGDPEGVFPDRVFTLGQHEAFLRDLDFLILALPHTQQSTGLIGERELRLLPSRAFILNPARGPIVQEPALLQALREGWIAGGAFDTHFVYPLPPEHPLWQFPNVILTPHVSGADHSALFPSRIGELFCANVERFLAGETLLNELTPAEWREA